MNSDKTVKIRKYAKLVRNEKNAPIKLCFKKFDDTSHQRLVSWSLFLNYPKKMSILLMRVNYRLFSKVRLRSYCIIVTLCTVVSPSESANSRRAINNSYRCLTIKTSEILTRQSLLRRNSEKLSFKLPNELGSRIERIG